MWAARMLVVASLFMMMEACAMERGLNSSIDEGLIGYWKLAGDCQDYSGQDNHGICHGVLLDAAGPDGTRGQAALFNGRDSYIEVPHSPSFDFGTDDLSISLWIKTRDSLDDVIGDILSKFDPERRRGINFTVMHHAGCTSSQSNYRHLLFGIDDGRIEQDWTDCGRPGEGIFVSAMTVFDGSLHVGTCEPEEGQAGHVYRYLGGTDWEDLGSPDASNTVMAICVYQGRLYAGTARYDTRGSALAASPNENLGGRVYRYEGDKRWTDCGQLPDATATYALSVYRDRLYGIAMYSPGVFVWDGGTGWDYCGTPGDERSMALAVHDGFLWVSGNGSAGVLRYEGGTRWHFCGKQEDNSQTYSFAIHRGDMYVGTWPDGSVHRYEGGTDWLNVGRLGEEREVMAMTIYNGKLYAGTLPLAQVYRYDGDDNWRLTGQIDDTPDVTYRRAWSMAVYGGKLYAGTLPTGRVWSMEAGKSVTYDRELPSGWRHLAAVKEGTRLRLYLDGALVATSTDFVPADYELATDQPLKIGFGAHDYFRGSMRELRMHRRALSDQEVAELYRGQ